MGLKIVKNNKEVVRELNEGISDGRRELLCFIKELIPTGVANFKNMMFHSRKGFLLYYNTFQWNHYKDDGYDTYRIEEN